jgi:hypothetical protein
MRVVIVGDVHGEFVWLLDYLNQVRQTHGVTLAIQVGDFGFYPKAIARAIRIGLRFPFPVHAIDGNHEDHGWLWSTARTTWSRALNVVYHPRGSVWRCGRRWIGFLGGALHVDRPQVGLDERWRPEHPGSANWIRDADCSKALDTFAELPMDLLVTHSCPAGIGIGMQGSPTLAPGVDLFVREEGFDTGPRDDVGEMALTRLWNAGIRPPAWVFGHFHRHHHVRIGRTDFHCVGRSDGHGRLDDMRPVVWDSITGLIEHEPER